MKIALISCTKLKASHPCTTREMYKASTLFKKAISYIEQQNYDGWYVLSAKYGLIDKDELIEPYDLTLNTMKAFERKQWSELVMSQIRDLGLNISHIDFYAGVKYRQYLIPALELDGISYKTPLQGKGIGEQLKYYTTNTQ